MKESDAHEDHLSQDDWQADWEGHRLWQLTAALDATPAQRLAWLEEMIQLAYRARRAAQRQAGE